MKSLEQTLLRQADVLLNRAASEVAPNADVNDARLSVLEAVSALHAGRDVERYWGAHAEGLQPSGAHIPWAEKLHEAIAATPIPVPLALSALGREVLSVSDQRKTGAYYTDWRLAQMLAHSSVTAVTAQGLWVDPACGSGILLTAACLAVPDGDSRDRIIRDQLCGADLSARALRATLLSVASLTRDHDAIDGFRDRLFLQDSLRSAERWADVAPRGAALVIANPPWERLRLSRHEAASATGQQRHYGQSFDHDIDLSSSRKELLAYVQGVVSGTRHQGAGEHDLYKLFLELGLGLAAEQGIVAMLVPAGLIRAQGTESLRRELMQQSRELEISVIENRQRHFAIDTRFKFLSITSRVAEGKKQPIALKVAGRTGAVPTTAVRLGRADLQAVRPDLSIPEVRSRLEWDLFARLSRVGVAVGDQDGPWHPQYRRELDMTNDQSNFRKTGSATSLPVLEGRHVSQFRYQAKRYRSGEGRAAIWQPQPLAGATLKPQWTIDVDDLRPATRVRTQRSRVGFCDITGQTNERTLLAARVPAGVVCGNKVPTLSFAAGGADVEDLFLAAANSFVVDWMLRRVVTTTVNFFLLDALPFPRLETTSPIGVELIGLTRRLGAAEGADAVDDWDVARLRARVDTLIARAWGVSLDEMQLILNDFPLLDRGQPALPDETHSTVTRDLVLATLAADYGESPCNWAERADNARTAGAKAYVPAEFV